MEPYGRPGSSGRPSLPGLRPPPPPAGRRDRAPVVILAILIPLLVVGLVWLLHTAAAPEGGTRSTTSVPSEGPTATR